MQMMMMLMAETMIAALIPAGGRQLDVHLAPGVVGAAAAAAVDDSLGLIYFRASSSPAVVGVFVRPIGRISFCIPRPAGAAGDVGRLFAGSH